MFLLGSLYFRMCQLFGDISLRISLASGYIGCLIPYFLSPPVSRVVSLLLVCLLAVYLSRSISWVASVSASPPEMLFTLDDERHTVGMLVT